MPDLSSLHESISAGAFADESASVEPLLAYLEPLRESEAEMLARATAWVQELRAQPRGAGVEALLHTYSLESREGVALMCLAEALLRIPDSETADRLIRGTFEHKQWSQALGKSEGWLIGASSWGLLLTGKVVEFGQDGGGVLGTAEKMIARLGEPVIRTALRAAMKVIGRQFVLGETMEEALAESPPYARQGYRFSYDVLGEGARTTAQAERYTRAYLEGIARIGAQVEAGTPLCDAPGISVKLSALHPRYQLTQHDRLVEELLPRLKAIAVAAKEAGIAVAVDAEEATRLDVEMLLFTRLLDEPDLAGWNGIGFVLQAYQKRAFMVLDWLSDLARAQKRIIPLRLVKGAYWDSEIKWAQAQGLPSYPVFTRKEHTDVSYLACAEKILSRAGCFYPQFATHNARTAAAIIAMAERHGVARTAYEFQRLHGMGEGLHALLLSEGFRSRIYAPVGAHKDLLAYLIRRLLENGANTSFVHLLMDEEKTPEQILADPVAAARRMPGEGIPPPPQLYGASRRNSLGMDFGNRVQLKALEDSLRPFREARWSTGEGFANAACGLNEPGNIARPIGSVRFASETDVESACATARRVFPSWAATPSERRARILEAAADLLEANRPELIALCAREAGRTLADGWAEVREAADFCRYYAAEARRILMPQYLDGPTGESNRLTLHPRGVFACISPWNFPLAIFTGQIAAALATGNSVIAKPAEETPLMAARAVELLHQAGVPRDVLQLLPGAGEVGAGLVRAPRIDGVVFTGSVETAQRIHQALATRGGALVPLIAETGGLNCMVVDSSALLEQAVDDVLLSAFGSAGQRCSAARILCVQDDIADDFLALLAGAVAELRIGDPLDPATDIGPVISAAAKQNLEKHIARLTRNSKLIARGKLSPALAERGYFVAPHVFEIGRVTEVTEEIFGPVLHVARFSGEAREALCDDINAMGYGLTFGIHSRVEENIEFFVSRVRAGNIYVNRSMIGAVVGVQPFGGEGLSGTGPKAGGPHYLPRFCTERSITVNTAAIGGNVTLLAGEEN